eukprot:TRINITY_DN1787_c0_g1_i4.p1 TRINITY_DN1787_c0_g1~~TRINITY_DN1787_c0_g1_i4.p1  ORF type:complete len:172 (+),score=31.12 TRINITY_DN1787_c0_g1_i4:56-571(+)
MCIRDSSTQSTWGNQIALSSDVIAILSGKGIKTVQVYSLPSISNIFHKLANATILTRFIQVYFYDASNNLIENIDLGTAKFTIKYQNGPGIPICAILGSDYKWILNSPPTLEDQGETPICSYSHFSGFGIIFNGTQQIFTNIKTNTKFSLIMQFNKQWILIFWIVIILTKY